MISPHIPSSRRGQAGAVNAMWLVVLMILWIGTIALLYFTNADIAAAQEARDAAIAERNGREAARQALYDEYKALSDLVGYYDATDISSRSDRETIRVRLDALKTQLGAALGGEDADVTIEQALDTLTSALRAAEKAAVDAEAAFAAEKDARAAADTRTRDIERTYSDQVAQLQTQLRDEQQRSANQSQADQSRFDDLISENRDADAAARTAQRDAEDTKVAAQKAAATAEATIKSLEMRRTPKAPDQPDGEVLAVSESNTVAWIDIGGRDGLTGGTRFELLRRDRSGELVSRGTVEVQEVESDMAMVNLVGQANAFDPMLPGDLVRNPHFEKGRQLAFYLLGEFPLTLSKEYVTGRLQALGAIVDESIGTTTDVLVLGEKNQAEGEFAEELTESDEYLKAEQLGLRIVRLDDLAEYLRF